VSKRRERRDRVANTGDGFAYEEPLLFERSRPGRQGYSLPALDVPAVDAAALLPEGAVRDDLPGLPELSEVDVVRHFTRLSTPPGTPRSTWASTRSARAP